MTVRPVHIGVAAAAFFATVAPACNCDESTQTAEADSAADGQGGDVHEGGCAAKCGALPHAGVGCTPAGDCVVVSCDDGWGDCNGKPDDGCEARLDTPDHCGTCEKVCSFNHAAAACVNGGCVMGACDDGWWDNDGDPANGCEYQCTVTNGGKEIPDGVDNDCNGVIDDTCEFVALSEPRKVDVNTGDASYPQMLWSANDKKYYAIWRDGHTGQGVIFFGVLDRDGALIGDVWQVSHGATGDAVNPSLLLAQDRFSAVWVDTRNGPPQVWMTLFDAVPSVVLPETVILDGGNPKLPNLQWDWVNGRYVMNWSDDHTGDDEIYMKFVSFDGTPAQETTLVSGYSGSSRGPGMSIVETGGAVAIWFAWVEQFPNDYKIYFVRIGGDGTRDSADLLVYRGVAWANGVSLTWNGTNFALSWDGFSQDHSTIFFQTVAPDYSMADPNPRTISAPRFDAITPYMTWTGVYYGLAWRDTSSGKPQVAMTIMDGRGRVSKSVFFVSKADRDVENPMALWNGEEFGVMWQQTQNDGSKEIWFRRVGCKTQ